MLHANYRSRRQLPIWQDGQRGLLEIEQVVGAFATIRGGSELTMAMFCGFCEVPVIEDGCLKGGFKRRVMHALYFKPEVCPCRS